MPEATEKLSFFRLPLLFAAAWIGTGVILGIVLVPLMSGGYITYFLAPLLLMDSITEIFTYTPVLFMVAAFVFRRNHFCRMDARAMKTVLKMAFCCFLLLKLAVVIQYVITTPFAENRRPYGVEQSVTGMALFWYCRILIAAGIAGLVAHRWTRPFYPQAPQFRLTPQNHRQTNSTILALLVMLFYFPLSFLITMLLADLQTGRVILQHLMYSFTTGYTGILLDLLIMAAVLIAVPYTAFGYSGEKLPVKRLLLTGVSGAVLYIAVRFGLMYVTFFILDSRYYGSPDATLNALNAAAYLNMVIVALILRVVVKRVFRAAPEDVLVKSEN